MLKFDEKNKKFEKLSATELKAEGILERHGLQETIVASWELFRNEIGLPTAFLIGDEVSPHPSVQNSIDLLAYNPDDSSLIVIELKRDRNKLQLLQALSYAAMVNTWDSEMLVSKISHKCNPEPQELIDLIQDVELNNDVKVVLIAEGFDPEVIITADWLSDGYSVDISAYAINMHKAGDDTFLTLEQRYPLKDLADTYESRVKRKRSRSGKKDVTWDEVLPKLEYPFAEQGIRLCSGIRQGDPSRRRFGSIRSNYDGFNWISINFRRKYINVYLKGDFEGAEDFLGSKFTDPISVNTWRDGYAFLIHSKSQFDDLVSWLRLDE